MRLVEHPLYKFDESMPIYNWMFPLQSELPVEHPAGSEAHRAFDLVDSSAVESRALYLHIPFCETICSFCPFVRGRYRTPDLIERYVAALVREIEVKARYGSLTSVPIGAIFVGGGTPSLLNPDQIRRLGEAINHHFDLSGLREFSFEFEVKSVTLEAVRALKEIGVTHGRFGVQTFDPAYREMFTLTSSVNQVRRAAAILGEELPFASFDLLYGMNGQSLEQLLYDLDEAIALGLDNVDIYPIDNVVTQRRLHRTFATRGMEPTSATAKLEMKILVAEYMRSACFEPHNGHGYVRAKTTRDGDFDTVSDAYCFHYHDHIYGYANRDLLGFGAGAVSIFDGFSVTNTASRERYVHDILDREDWEMVFSPQDPSSQQSRPVVMRLPYHGSLRKTRVSWRRVHPETLLNLARAIRSELVVDDGEELRLTRVGWYWYTELMYFLMPRREQAVLDDFIARKAGEPGRRIEDRRIVVDGSQSFIRVPS